jgi:dienelactone hydrolase
MLVESKLQTAHSLIPLCKVYISKPGDYPHSPSKLLLLLSGGTGLQSTNNQLQADMFASEGFICVMPDLFSGDPAPNSSIVLEDTAPSIIEQIKSKVAETAKSLFLDLWLARHTPEKVLPILQKVIDGSKEEFADAIANGDGIYCVGYCFGAKYCLLLAGERLEATIRGHKQADEELGVINRGPYIKAGAIAHGTLVVKEDFEDLRSPMMLICVENDQLFPKDVRDEGEKILKANSTEHEIIIYPDVPHGKSSYLTRLENTTKLAPLGFAVVGDYDDLNIKQAQSQAFNQMLSWLKRH